MKYTDEQRISKIYDYATKLKEYINENNVTKDELINDIHIQCAFWFESSHARYNKIAVTLVNSRVMAFLFVKKVEYH